MRSYLLLMAILFSITACKKENCQTCTKTIGGVAGNITDETKEVCSDIEATELEESSSGTTVWSCE